MFSGDPNRDNPLTEDEWKRLLKKIGEGKCTPFLGTDSGFPGAITRRELAVELREEYGCPWPDCDDLARVAQFIATTVSPIEPKEVVAARITDRPAPDFKNRQEGHRLLADLPFPIYVTTTLDPYLTAALVEAKKDVRERLCPWNDLVDARVSRVDFDPTPANPLVYRLYGATHTPDSLVVTEDDYLEFLARVSADRAIPDKVGNAIAHQVLLFFGYRLEDLEFRMMVRVILNQLMRNQNQSHLSIQLLNIGVERDGADRAKELQNFLARYCLRAPLYIRTCWVSALDFLKELRERWEKYHA